MDDVGRARRWAARQGGGVRERGRGSRAATMPRLSGLLPQKLYRAWANTSFWPLSAPYTVEFVA